MCAPPSPVRSRPESGFWFWTPAHDVGVARFLAFRRRASGRRCVGSHCFGFLSIAICALKFESRARVVGRTVVDSIGVGPGTEVASSAVVARGAGSRTVGSLRSGGRWFACLGRRT